MWPPVCRPMPSTIPRHSVGDLAAWGSKTPFAARQDCLGVHAAWAVAWPDCLAITGHARIESSPFLDEVNLLSFASFVPSSLCCFPLENRRDSSYCPHLIARALVGAMTSSIRKPWSFELKVTGMMCFFPSCLEDSLCNPDITPGCVEKTILYPLNRVKLWIEKRLSFRPPTVSTICLK